MKKIWIRQLLIFAFIFVLVLCSPVHTFAHTQLETSSPKEGELLTTEITEISLQFNTTIESLSSLKLINSANQEIPLDPTTINENTMIRQLSNGTALENGDYTVEWKIVGKDGHPIEGNYTFTVEFPEQPIVDSTKEDTGIAEVEEIEEEAVESTSEAEAASPNAGAYETQNKGESSSNWLYIPLALIIILVIALVSRRLMRRKK